MVVSITIAESTVLGAILEGRYRGLTELRRQIDHLDAYDRRREYHHYLAQFRPAEGLESKLSDSLIVARLVVSAGIISSLNIGGPFDFRQDFTICSYYWRNFYRIDTGEEYRQKATRMPEWLKPRLMGVSNSKTVFYPIHDPKLRDWAQAIGYTPTYR